MHFTVHVRFILHSLHIAAIAALRFLLVHFYSCAFSFYYTLRIFAFCARAFHFSSIFIFFIIIYVRRLFILHYYAFLTLYKIILHFFTTTARSFPHLSTHASTACIHRLSFPLRQVKSGGGNGMEKKKGKEKKN